MKPNCYIHVIHMIKKFIITQNHSDSYIKRFICHIHTFSSVEDKQGEQVSSLSM